MILTKINNIKMCKFDKMKIKTETQGNEWKKETIQLQFTLVNLCET